ncbi:MAG: site-specific DNA-methyltransferase [Dehalococcoidales bacterium]|nr:site-specific DNA-methyltransferase [Dehalococcoidales bacterium]
MDSFFDIGVEPYYENRGSPVRLFQGDCLEILPRFMPNSIDMIFADPPYFLSNGGITCHAGRMVSVNKGDWDVSRGVEENHKFNLAWLSECQRVLTENGVIWVSGTAHVIFSVGFAMQQLGFKLLNDVIWFKPNASPNLSCRYFTHSTETVIWAAKNKKSKHIFNYDLMKQMNGGKQMRNLWEIPPPQPSEKTHGKHPTQKPSKLLERILLASTNEGDVVLDPFNGSGTTGVVALKLGRKYIGIELSQEYLNLTVKRLQDEFRTPRLQLNAVKVSH